MKQRIALTLILLALLLYAGGQAIAQVNADKAFNDYEWYIVSIGQSIPDTSLQYAGAEITQSNDYNESISLHFMDESSGEEIDMRSIVENDEIKNGVKFGEVILFEDEFQQIGLAITVKVPRVPRGTFMDRLWTRMINPFGGG